MIRSSKLRETYHFSLTFDGDYERQCRIKRQMIGSQIHVVVKNLYSIASRLVQSSLSSPGIFVIFQHMRNLSIPARNWNCIQLLLLSLSVIACLLLVCCLPDRSNRLVKRASHDITTFSRSPRPPSPEPSTTQLSNYAKSAFTGAVRTRQYATKSIWTMGMTWSLTESPPSVQYSILPSLLCARC
jgi:hypothetical protein